MCVRININALQNVRVSEHKCCEMFDAVFIYYLLLHCSHTLPDTMFVIYFYFVRQFTCDVDISNHVHDNNNKLINILLNKLGVGNYGSLLLVFWHIRLFKNS